MNRATTVYNAIVRYYAAHEVMPTAKQLQRALGCETVNQVYGAFYTLVQRGWIRRYWLDTLHMELMRPTERGLTPAQLAELLRMAG